MFDFGITEVQDNASMKEEMCESSQAIFRDQGGEWELLVAKGWFEGRRCCFARLGKVAA